MVRMLPCAILVTTACSETLPSATHGELPWSGECPPYSGGTHRGVVRIWPDRRDELVLSFDAEGTALTTIRTTDTLVHNYLWRCREDGVWRTGSETLDRATGQLLYEERDDPGALLLPSELDVGISWVSTYTRTNRDLVAGITEVQSHQLRYDAIDRGTVASGAGVLDILVLAIELKITSDTEDPLTVGHELYVHEVLGEVDSALIAFQPPLLEP